MSETIQQLKLKIYSTEKFTELLSTLKNTKLIVSGISGSLSSFIIDFCYSNYHKKLFVISHDDDRIVKLKDDINLLNDSASVSVYSSALSDGESLSKILIDLSDSKEFIVVTNSADLQTKIITKNKFQDSLVSLRKGDNYSFDNLIETLSKYHFTKKDFVDEQGDYSVRGGIVDLFPENLECPVRIDFFGDTIESIREFDLNSQRSIKEVESVKVGINLSTDDEEKNFEIDESILDYVPEDCIVFVDEPEIINKDTEISDKFKKIYLTGFARAMTDEKGFAEFNFNSKPQPDFHSNLKNLYNNLCENITNGFEVSILTSDDFQAKRIKELIEDFEDENIIRKDEVLHQEPDAVHGNVQTDKMKISIRNNFRIISESIHNGFILDDSKLLIYTEHQIFGRYFKLIKKRKLKFKGLTFSELKELQYGDYIVHRDFGIGIYSGLKKIKVGNNRQEVVVLSYQGNDTLFLNLNYINLIKKYSASEGHVPALTKLGGGEWDRLKARTKKQVKDIARDLIALYAKRKSEIGFKFSNDTHWQKELEANFMYEDTPDQYKATVDTKDDMESETPMDRLICGDVGFGKTEVAVRAAFKAVLDNKQVAVLVPTTI